VTTPTPWDVFVVKVKAHCKRPESAIYSGTDTDTFAKAIDIFVHLYLG